ncbi:MAG: CPBP family intramembrane glutamic endopeptidase [Anaerolineales bacterium]
MLFALKTRLSACILAAAILAGTSLVGIQALALPVDLGRISWAWVLAGAGAMLSSDAALHFFLWKFGGPEYRSRFKSLVEYFQKQGFGEIAAGSVLAASEELFFRGFLLAFLVGVLGASGPLSLTLTAGAFGLAHLLPKPWAWTFAVWAAWEGILLGVVYLASGSLITVALTHAIHDAAGFVVFLRLKAKTRG